MSKNAKIDKRNWIMFSTLVPKQLRLKLKALAKRKKIGVGELVVSALSKIR